MNQTYVYRKHLRSSFLYFILMELSLFIGIAIMLFSLIFSNEWKLDGLDIIIITIILFAMFLLISFEMLIIYLVLIKRFKSINVTVTNHAIEYTNSKGMTIIPYEDIEKLEFPSIKYTGGWVKIKFKGGSIRLTVVLEHIGDFICELKEKLNEREMAHVYNEKKMFSFFKTAVFSDESWERVYHNYKVQLLIHYLCIIFTTVILCMFENSRNNKLYIYGSLAAPFLGYLISEIIIGFKIKKRVDREGLRLLPRNLAFEQKSFRLSILAFSIGYLLFLLVAMLF